MSGPTTRMWLPAALPRACAAAARRPASWIAAAVAAAVPACAVWWSLPPAPCALAAVLACLAAIGDVPTGLLRPGDRGGRGEVAFWTLVRALWPVAGGCLGAVMVVMLVMAGGQAFMTAAVCGAAVLAAAASSAVSRGCGAKAADAAAVVILLAALAAAAARAVPGSLVTRAVVAGLAWLFGAGLAWSWWLVHRRAGPLSARAGAAGGHPEGEFTAIGPLPSSGPLRQWLGRLAMLTALGGMAGWLVPEPSGPTGETAAAADAVAARLNAALLRSMPWAAATAAWFLALAVPHALLQDGVGGAAAWERLLRTAATVEGHRARLGAARFSAGVSLTHAAVLGWPPLVAAVLSLPSPAASIPPLVILAGLAVGAGGIAVVGACGARLAVSRETLFALMLAFAAGLVMTAWHWSAALPSSISPILPSLGGPRP